MNRLSKRANKIARLEREVDEAQTEVTDLRGLLLRFVSAPAHLADDPDDVAVIVSRDLWSTAAAAVDYDRLSGDRP